MNLSCRFIFSQHLQPLNHSAFYLLLCVSKYIFTFLMDENDLPLGAVVITYITMVIGKINVKKNTCSKTINVCMNICTRI